MALYPRQHFFIRSLLSLILDALCVVKRMMLSIAFSNALFFKTSVNVLLGWTGNISILFSSLSMDMHA